MNRIDFTSDVSLITREEFGGKAMGIAWLALHGYPVPRSTFLKALEVDACQLFDWEQWKSSLSVFLASYGKRGRYQLAIRSSATIEDSADESLAGHFDTYLGRMTIDEVTANVKDLLDRASRILTTRGGRMGIVFQELVPAKWAGVIFSSNPLSGCKTEAVCSLVSGRGDKLVSGTASGEDLVLDLTQDVRSFRSTLGLPGRVLEQLSISAKQIEEDVSLPVDIEWCVDRRTRSIVYLQCRPVARLAKSYGEVLPVGESLPSHTTASILQADKIKMRLDAGTKAIVVSDAYVVLGGLDNSGLHDSLSRLHLSPRCEAASLVLIHPRHSGGSVLRLFTPPTGSGALTSPLPELSVLRSPDAHCISDGVNSILERVVETYWNPAIIIQEVWNPTHTGVVSRIGERFILEVGLGHFVSKGLVNTSKYILDPTGNILDRQNATQLSAYRILNGYVLEERFSRPLTSEISDKVVQKIVTTFDEYIARGDTVEFGIVVDDHNSPIPYLIDLGFPQKGSDGNLSDLASGVLSPGVMEGRIVNLNLEQHGGFDSHLHDERAHGQEGLEEKVVFVCEMTHIAFLGVMDRYKDANIGFVFRSGSILSHLALVLRERRVPAVILPDLHLDEGELVRLDATTPGLRSNERITYV